MVFEQESHPDWKNTYVLFDFSFLDFFPSQDFLIKPLRFTVNSFRRRVACESGERLCANHIIYYVSGTLFSRRRPWGGSKCVTVVKLTFSKKVFSFCPHFEHLFFSSANVADSYQITAFGGRRANLWPPLGGSPCRRRKRFYIVKTMVFA